MTTAKPTLHVTNFSSRKLYGDGNLLTIMAMPRHWEKGDGRVIPLIPSLKWVRDVQAGKLSLDGYRSLYEEHLKQHDLSPGTLSASAWVMRRQLLVSDGDTLCCACSRMKAANGECHRRWAAEALAHAGWLVIVDGTLVLDYRHETIEVT